ncbi:hypothetical protein M141_0667 [Bacteroides fragilis str. S38L5]|nr:hypothetical protein M141_0667 [Bacteroides fragilis str. S38L5]
MSEEVEFISSIQKNNKNTYEKQICQVFVCILWVIIFEIKRIV